MATRPAPRWLTDDQQAVWRSYIAMVRQLNEALERQLHEDSEMAMSDYVLLMRLSEAPHHQLRMSELATDSVYSRSRLSHAVSRLESWGWVRRMGCDDDRRGTFAQLTDEGLAMLAAAAPGHATAVHDLMFEPLGDDGAAEFGELVGQILDRLSQDRV
jgi:DNA-binding MarR family transcriptional regulator